MNTAETTESSNPNTQVLRDSSPAVQEDIHDHGPGIYAVPVLPFLGEMTQFPPCDLIPIKYNVPVRPEGSTGVVNGEGQQEAQQEQHQEGQVMVRRFHFAIQIDLMLIFKLAAVVVLFNQEGSWQTLFPLILFATLIYLYQTGAFAPLIRWLRQVGGNPRLLRENPPQPANDTPPGAREEPEGNGEENVGEGGGGGGGGGNGNDWRAFVREMKILVVTFLTSLFPGFHLHHD